MTLKNYFKILILKVSLITIFTLIFSLSAFSQHKTKIVKFHPTPDWVKTYPKPALKKKYDMDLVLIKDETQYNHVLKEKYEYSLYYLNTKDGVNNISSYSLTYEQDYEVFKLHKVRIIRNNQIIDLSDNIHIETELTGEQIGGKWYDNKTRVRIYLDKTQVGDMVEIAHTKVGGQPDVRNVFTFYQTGTNEKLIGKSYLRVLTSKDKPPFYKVVNQINPVSKRTIGEYIEVEHIRSIDEPFKFTSDPDWYFQEETILFTDCKSWEEIVDLNILNFQLDKPVPKTIKEKVDDLTKGIERKEEKIKIILDYIQREIEYLDYGLIEPKRPELVNEQGYGDCKSSTLLTIKMLEYINVEAWVVMVKARGFDDRFVNTPSMALFDHAIMEFVFEGDTLFFDATADFQYGNIYQKYISDFKYGLRIVKGNNALTKIRYQNHNKTIFSSLIKLEQREHSDMDYNVERKVKFYGELTNRSIAFYNKYGTWEVWKNLVDDYVGTDWCRNYVHKNDIIDTFYYNKNISFSTLYHRLKNCSHAYDNVDGENKIRIKPEPLREWLTIHVPRSKTYLPLPDFNKTEHHFRICTKDSINFEADTMLVETDWIRYYKKTWQENDTIYGFYSAEILKPFVNAKRFEEVKDTLRNIREQMDMFVDKEAVFERQRDRDKSYEVRDYTLLVFVFFLTIIVLFIWTIVSKRRKQKRRLKQLEEEVEYLNEKVKRLKQL